MKSLYSSFGLPSPSIQTTKTGCNIGVRLFLENYQTPQVGSYQVGTPVYGSYFARSRVMGYIGSI